MKERRSGNTLSSGTRRLSHQKGVEKMPCLGSDVLSRVLCDSKFCPLGMFPSALCFKATSEVDLGKTVILVAPFLQVLVWESEDIFRPGFWLLLKCKYLRNPIGFCLCLFSFSAMCQQQHAQISFWNIVFKPTLLVGFPVYPLLSFKCCLLWGDLNNG